MNRGELLDLVRDLSAKIREKNEKIRSLEEVLDSVMQAQQEEHANQPNRPPASSSSSSPSSAAAMAMGSSEECVRPLPSRLPQRPRPSAPMDDDIDLLSAPHHDTTESGPNMLDALFGGPTTGSSGLPSDNNNNNTAAAAAAVRVGASREMLEENRPVAEDRFVGLLGGLASSRTLDQQLLQCATRISALEEQLRQCEAERRGWEAERRGWEAEREREAAGRSTRISGGADERDGKEEEGEEERKESSRHQSSEVGAAEAVRLLTEENCRLQGELSNWQAMTEAAQREIQQLQSQLEDSETELELTTVHAAAMEQQQQQLQLQLQQQENNGSSPHSNSAVYRNHNNNTNNDTHPVEAAAAEKEEEEEELDEGDETPKQVPSTVTPRLGALGSVPPLNHPRQCHHRNRLCHPTSSSHPHHHHHHHHAETATSMSTTTTSGRGADDGSGGFSSSRSDSENNRILHHSHSGSYPSSCGIHEGDEDIIVPRRRIVPPSLSSIAAIVTEREEEEGEGREHAPQGDKAMHKDNEGDGKKQSHAELHTLAEASESAERLQAEKAQLLELLEAVRAELALLKQTQLQERAPPLSSSSSSSSSSPPPRHSTDTSKNLSNNINKNNKEEEEEDLDRRDQLNTAATPASDTRFELSPATDSLFSFSVPREGLTRVPSHDTATGSTSAPRPDHSPTTVANICAVAGEQPREPSPTALSARSLAPSVSQTSNVELVVDEERFIAYAAELGHQFEELYQECLLLKEHNTALSRQVEGLAKFKMAVMKELLTGEESPTVQEVEEME